MNKPSKKGNKARAKLLQLLIDNIQPVAPMSYQEIAKQMGYVSTNTVHWHLKKLEERGDIEIIGQRSIKVLV